MATVGRLLRGAAPSPEERDLYEALCSESWDGNRRAEQERIPLPLAASALRQALDESAVAPEKSGGRTTSDVTIRLWVQLAS
jgi:hypothetical protein